MGRYSLHLKVNIIWNKDYKPKGATYREARKDDRLLNPKTGRPLPESTFNRYCRTLPSMEGRQRSLDNLNRLGRLPRKKRRAEDEQRQKKKKNPADKNTSSSSYDDDDDVSSDRDETDAISNQSVNVRSIDKEGDNHGGVLEQNMPSVGRADEIDTSKLTSAQLVKLAAQGPTRKQLNTLSDDEDEDEFGEFVYRSSRTAKCLKLERNEVCSTSNYADDVSTDNEEAETKLYQPVSVKSMDEGEETDDDWGVK